MKFCSPEQNEKLVLGKPGRNRKLRRKRLARKAVAIAVVTALFAGLLPGNLLRNGADFSVVQAAESRSEVLSADDAENLGADSHFKLNEVTIDGNSKTFSVDGSEVTVSKRIKLSKNVGSATANSIGVTVSTGYTASLDVYAISSNGDTGASLNLFKSNGDAVKDENYTMDGSKTQAVTKFSFSGLAAGTYYLASNDSNLKPANIYYLKITETEVSDGPINRKAWSEVSDPVITADPIIADGKTYFHIGYKMVIGDDGADSLVLSALKPDSSTAEIKTDMEANDGTAFVYADYTPNATGIYTLKATASRQGETDKTAETTLAYQLPLGTAEPVVLAGDQQLEITWKAVPEATSYDVVLTLAGAEFVNVPDMTDTKAKVTGLENGTEYGVKVITHRSTTATDTETTSTEIMATPVAPEEGVDWFSANNCATQTVSGEYVYPDNSNYSVMNGVAIQDCDAVTATDGTIFVKRLSAGAAPKDTEGTFLPANGKSYKITLDQLSNISVYCKSSGDAERVLRLADASGNTIRDFAALSKSSDLVPSTAVNLEAGTYYLYSTNSTVYLFGIKVKEGKAPRKAWDQVDVPVIDNVERLEDGSLAVTFSAEFGDDGADSGRVFMYQNGFEVSSTAVSASGTVNFKPQTNGDFTFEVVISREKCADKRSDIAEFTDYVLPPAAPAITWLNNLGNGSVYVDWNNVTPDNGCSVMIKAEDEADFTTVSTGNTDGNITLTGLTQGKTYTVQVVANDSKTGNAVSSREITVGAPVQQWYADDFGSATSGKITVNGTEVAVKSYSELYPVSKNPVADVTDGSGDILMTLEGNKNGKIADSEEGLQVYYTRINPNTENFKLTATFELYSDAILDNQSGFGIYALDIAGLGTKDAKYMNSVAVGNFKLKVGDANMYHANGVRVVTGYSTYDPTSTAGTGRVLDNGNAFSEQPADVSTLEVGRQFTYTLEKTDEGFIATMGGETISVPDVTKIMQQEDGSIVVAVASARCDAKVTNITFEKSEGSVVGGGTVTEITPEVSVYSANTTGEADYEFVIGANVAGSVAIFNGTEALGSAQIVADQVAKLPVTLWNPGAANKITYSFQPDKNVADLTSYDEIRKDYTVTWRVHGVEDQVVYTAPDAPANGLGTKEDPVDLQTALKSAVPGQTIIMLDGTYSPKSDLIIPRNVKGTAEKNITLMPENDGKVKVTGENLTSSASLITIVGDYWHIYGIEFCDTPGKGVSVCGNYNTVEMCTMHNTGNSGLQISRYSGEPNDQEMWPSYNLIKNCESYDNCDPGRNDADGFAAKLTCGEGNKFYGCISHHNIDDGWDLYAKSTTGEIGAVVIENCVAYSNGWLTTDDPTDPSTAFGEGNGFKLGGENMYGGHRLINSVSFNNYAKGITSNSCPDCEVINCTAYNNSLNGKAYNISLYTKTSNEKAWVVFGTISLATNGKTLAELGSSNGVIYSLKDATNYFFDGNASLNDQGVEATEDWFESVDVTIVPTRNADGTINMHGLLVLKDYAPKDTGARINDATDPEAVSSKPEPAGKTAERMVRQTVTEGISESSLTDEVKKATGISSVAELEEYMAQSAAAKAESINGSAVYDVLVEVSFDGGKVWVPSTAETFPVEGLDILLPYPKGTDAENYDFVVTHLITVSVNGASAGDLEYMKAEETKDGILVHASSASPFAVGYTKVASEDEDNTEDTTGGQGSNPGRGGNVQTDDPTDVTGWMMLMLLSGAMLITLGSIKKKRSK